MQTIFALSTAPGKAGVAIIRISGPSALKAIRFLGVDQEVKDRVAYFTKIRNPNDEEIIDEIIYIYFRAPKSFTGEDMLELHVHGSRAVISEVISLLGAMPDFRLAEPGEFTLRAFLAGKIDLTEAEGLADLIDSETKAQKKQAIRQLQGSLEKLYSEWRKKLLNIMALVEAYIDFPDEDLPGHIVDDFTRQINGLKSDIRNHLSDNNRGQKLRDGLLVAIIGEPNVGKSSLLNMLAKKELAIVSSIAGTTRDVIEVSIDIAGYPFIVADTAGMRETEDEIEQEGVRRALGKAREADINIIMLDASKNEDISNQFSEFTNENSIVLVNKTDINPEYQYKGEAIYVSVRNNYNIDLLMEKLANLADKIAAPSEAPVITRERHRINLEHCLNALNDFSFDKNIELAGEDLRIASNYLGKITGRIDVEDILSEIFSNFCIGK